MPDLRTPSRASAVSNASVIVAFVRPAFSSKAVVTMHSPGYHDSSNRSVWTMREGGDTSRKTPRTPIVVPLSSFLHS